MKQCLQKKIQMKKGKKVCKKGKCIKIPPIKHQNGNYSIFQCSVRYFSAVIIIKLMWRLERKFGIIHVASLDPSLLNLPDVWTWMVIRLDHLSCDTDCLGEHWPLLQTVIIQVKNWMYIFANGLSENCIWCDEFMILRRISYGVCCVQCMTWLIIMLYCMAQSNMRHRLAKHSHVIDKHFSILYGLV